MDANGAFFQSNAMKPFAADLLAVPLLAFALSTGSAQNTAPAAATNAAGTNAPRRGGNRPAPETTPQAPETLPGNGLAQHDFLYAGENGNHLNLYIIRKGKVDWSYTHPGRGEISDAMLLSNGNVLFARQFGVTEVSPDKKVVWNYDAPAGNEVHTAQAIGKDHVLFVQNGNPALLKVVNTTTGETNVEFELPVRGTNRNQVHTQFRHARLTAAGTVLVGHMDLNKICEYDSNGKQISSWDSPSPWTVAELEEWQHSGDVRKPLRPGNHAQGRRGLGVSQGGSAGNQDSEHAVRGPFGQRQHGHQQLAHQGQRHGRPGI